MARKIIEPCGLHCIRVKDLGVTVGEQEILQHINLHIHCGNLAAVIGKNGAGKSTLIRAILGEVQHTGNIEFSMHGKQVVKNNGMELKIGYVPQKLNVEKKTPVSVYDMIACYQSTYPVFFKKNKKLYDKIKENLAIFQAEELIDKQVCNLSGGELQRILLSMAIMDEPDLLLLDEPVSGIDQNGMDLFYYTISELKKHYDLAIILISHDLDYVARYADQVILIDEKTIVRQGTVQQVYESPEFLQVFGGFDLDTYKPRRGIPTKEGE